MKSMALASSLFVTLVGSLTLANWTVLDSKIASCEANVTLNLNTATGKKILVIDNINCNKVKIDTLGFDFDATIARGKKTSIDVSAFSGVILPVRIDNQFLQLKSGPSEQSEKAAPIVIIKNERTEAEQLLTEARLKEQRRRNAEANAKATVEAANIAVGLANEATKEVLKGEH